MTKEELTKLDNYGHRELKSLTEDQLKEYMVLLETVSNYSLIYS
ncbi:unnamed protein product, partial [marine sediment metagenome]